MGVLLEYPDHIINELGPEFGAFVVGLVLAH